jgi:hypothetical protein
MKIEVKLGHPIQMSLHGLTLLIFGGASGIRWGASWYPLEIAVLAAILMIVHGWLAAIVWSLRTPRLIGKA